MERRRAALAAITMMAALACSESVGMMGDAMIDAGDALVDAGNELLDADDADAQVPPVTMEAPCDREIVLSRLTDRASGEVLGETIQYYAEVDYPGMSAGTVARAQAIGCDRQVFGIPPETCSGSLICERDELPPMRCSTGPNVEIDDGRVRAVCGSQSRTRSAPGASLQIIGQRWSTIRFTVE